MKKVINILSVIVFYLVSFPISGQKPDPLDMRWTFGAHEPYTMYRRIGRKSTGGIDGNARWVRPWMDWFDSEAPALMESLGLNWLHCRFYKGMGWKVEKDDFPKVRNFVANCHAHGVHALAYVQFGTLYPEIMEDEIPDVESWAQVNSDGKPNLYTHNQYFRTMPCINCTEWEEYIKKMCTIALTEGGFDGIMFDNLFSYFCCCDRCEESFSAYLDSLPDKEERFGFKSVKNIHIPKNVQDSYFVGEVRDPVIQAWLQWRAETTSALVSRLVSHIKSVKPDAVVAANTTPLRQRWMPWKHGTDIVDLAGILDIVVGQSLRYPSYKDGKIVSRIRDLKLARDIGAIDVALCDVDAMMTPEHEKHYLLPLYEDLVFGGVPTDRTIISPKPVEGFIDRKLVEKRRPELESFNAFVRDHRGSFEAPVYAPVRLLMPVRELEFSEASDNSLCAAEEILTRRHIPWGYVVSTPSNPFQVPEGTEVIIVSGLRNLSTVQVKGLTEWARRGGRLVITGDSGRYDALNAQYLVNPLIEAVKDLPNVVVRADADTVSPFVLEFGMDVGVPSDGGDALVGDIAATGFELPFKITGCPEYVAVDVRTTVGGYVLHFVNYNPSVPVKGLGIRGSDGGGCRVPQFSEYACVPFDVK